MKETKTGNLLEKAIDSCGENESLFAIHATSDVCNVVFNGHIDDVACGVAHIIANALDDNASKKEKKMANGLFNGLYRVLCQGDKASVLLARVITDIITDAMHEIESKAIGKDNLAPSEFNPNSKECLACDDYPECGMLWLVDHVLENNNGKKKTKKIHKNGKGK